MHFHIRSEFVNRKIILSETVTIKIVCSPNYRLFEENVKTRESIGSSFRLPTYVSEQNEACPVDRLQLSSSGTSLQPIEGIEEYRGNVVTKNADKS